MGEPDIETRKLLDEMANLDCGEHDPVAAAKTGPPYTIVRRDPSNLPRGVFLPREGGGCSYSLFPMQGPDSSGRGSLGGLLR